LKLPSGDRIPIEERNPREVTHMGGKPLVPKETKAANPAFDVTPNKYIKAIITEKGIARRPYRQSLKKLFI
jgi:methylthioribose-1-phosphate isomerase